jgi:hypothetical protein
MSRKEFPERTENTQATSNLLIGPTTKVVSPTTVTLGALRNVYASTVAPVDATDGADGDIWFKYA